MEISDRLKQARIRAGFRSASEAANNYGWTNSTYAAHENGTRGVKVEDAKKYALAFRTDPGYLLFGTETAKSKVAGVPEDVLKEILTFVMSHEGARDAPPEVISDLVIELCHYVSKSGSSGLAQIVDFSLAKRAVR
jgi:DNA-binding XRE family transcriptional regulator